LVVFAIACNLLNGFNNADAFLHNAAKAHPWIGLSFWVGSGIFIAGFILHVHADTTIRQLRQPANNSYHIPVVACFGG
jgi:hypothetical protein